MVSFRLLLIAALAVTSHSASTDQDPEAPKVPAPEIKDKEEATLRLCSLNLEKNLWRNEQGEVFQVLRADMNLDDTKPEAQKLKANLNPMTEDASPNVNQKDAPKMMTLFRRMTLGPNVEAVEPQAPVPRPLITSQSNRRRLANPNPHLERNGRMWWPFSSWFGSSYYDYPPPYDPYYDPYYSAPPPPVGPYYPPPYY